MRPCVIHWMFIAACCFSTLSLVLRRHCMRGLPAGLVSRVAVFRLRRPFLKPVCLCSCCSYKAIKGSSACVQCPYGTHTVVHSSRPGAMRPAYNTSLTASLTQARRLLARARPLCRSVAASPATAALMVSEWRCDEGLFGQAVSMLVVLSFRCCLHGLPAGQVEGHGGARSLYRLPGWRFDVHALQRSYWKSSFGSAACSVSVPCPDVFCSLVDSDVLSLVQPCPGNSTGPSASPSITGCTIELVPLR